MTSRASIVERLRPDAETRPKTFLLEVHADEPQGYLHKLAASSVVPTDDAYLFRLSTADGDFWVDQLDRRFWSFHTTMKTRPATRYLRARVQERRDLDWVWLPSQHLRNLWPAARTRALTTDFRGTGFLPDGVAIQGLQLKMRGDAEAFFEHVSERDDWQPALSFDSTEVEVRDPELGVLTEGVRRMGILAFGGDSVEFHLQFVRAVVTRYRRLVEACERNAIGWRSLGDDGGGAFDGEPIVVDFSRPVPDLAGFVDELFSSREPARLWGVPTIEHGVARVEAVDLHVGQRLRIEFGPDWMRAYLPAGACGNTVARLISTLQHRFDGNLRFRDPALQDALVGTAKAAAGR